MYDINLTALEESITSTRQTLKEGVLSIDIWDKNTGLSLVDWQGNPTAVALFNQVLQDLSAILKASNFPLLKDYLYLDLKDNKSVVLISHGEELFEGWLLDSAKTNPGILLGIAIPKAIQKGKMLSQ